MEHPVYIMSKSPDLGFVLFTGQREEKRARRELEESLKRA